MKSLKSFKNSKKQQLQFSPLVDEEGFIRAKGKICKSQLEFNARQTILLLWKNHAVELFLQNEHKNDQHEGKEHDRNNFQKKMDPSKTKRLTVDQKQVCYAQKMQNTNDNTTDGPSTRRKVRSFNSL